MDQVRQLSQEHRRYPEWEDHLRRPEDSHRQEETEREATAILEVETAQRPHHHSWQGYLREACRS
jgi:hypothetical protein